MASRMDRYYKNELIESGRSAKNQSLYDQIDNLDNYSNIEGVAAIEKTNEIDISKVQEMIKNREEYKKRRQLKDILKEEQEELEHIDDVVEEPRNYNIKDLLKQVEENMKTESKSRSLDKKQYDELKSLRSRDKTYDIQKEEQELRELINTISNTKMLEASPKDDDDLGLLDDLKSDTMVGDAASIKKILEEEKKDVKLDNTTPEIDKEFYTSSFGFTKSDFEDLKNMNKNIKKSNKFIIILLISLIALIAIVGIVFLIIK